MKIFLYILFVIFNFFSISFSKDINSKKLTLDPKTAVAIFIHNNYDILIDKYNIDKAYANYLESKAYPNPIFSIALTQYRIKDNKLINADASDNIGITQLILMGGKHSLNQKMALESYKETKFIHKDVVRNLLIGFLSLYYQVVIDKIAMKNAKDDLENFNKVLKVAKYQHEFGFLSDLDYFKLSVQKVNFQTAYIQAKTQYKNDLSQLKNLMRIKGDIELSPPPSVSELLSFKPNLKLYEKEAENRYDIRALKNQIIADIYNLKLQKAQNIPDLSVTAQLMTVGTSSYNNEKYPLLYGIGLSFPIPVFDRNVGGILNATYSIKQDRLALKKAIDNAKLQVKHAYNNFISSKESFQEYENKKKEIEKILDISQKSFALRGISVLDLLDAERTYADFMASYRTALYNLILNRVLLDLYSKGNIGETI